MKSCIRLPIPGFLVVGFFPILKLDCKTDTASKITFNRSGFRIDFILRKTSRSIMTQDLQNTYLQLLIWLHLTVNYGKWTRRKYIGSWNLQYDPNNRSATEETHTTIQNCATDFSQRIKHITSDLCTGGTHGAHRAPWLEEGMSLQFTGPVTLMCITMGGCGREQRQTTGTPRASTCCVCRPLTN